MYSDQVRVRELCAWGLDDYKFRPDDKELRTQAETAQNVCDAGPITELKSPIVQPIPAQVSEKFGHHAKRIDLHAEFSGLEWTIGVVDLRQLIAFQRRLVFDEQISRPLIPAPGDWSALIELSFGPPVSVSDRLISFEGSQLIVQSGNPNLQLRASYDQSSFPLLLHGGSPFMEIGGFRGRWFLRDGYHRAFNLLSAGVHHVPAVIVRAQTLRELGSVKPHFFSEEVLFSDRPPLVVDFLNDSLIIEYHRPRLFKTLRISIEESIEPTLFAGNTGEEQ